MLDLPSSVFAVLVLVAGAWYLADVVVTLPGRVRDLLRALDQWFGSPVVAPAARPSSSPAGGSSTADRRLRRAGASKGAAALAPVRPDRLLARTARSHHTSSLPLLVWCFLALLIHRRLRDV